MKSIMTFWTCLEITGYTDSTPDFHGKKTRKEYNCFVSYSSVKANNSIVSSYLKYYCSCDPEDSNSFQFFNDHNCGRALITYYFRDLFQLFEVKDLNFVSERNLPNRPPDKKDKNHKIWVAEINSKDLDTAKSAAKCLFDLCSNQKLSTDIAQRIVQENFPKNTFSWQAILSEFSQMGGAYTKKYLRR